MSLPLDDLRESVMQRDLSVKMTWYTGADRAGLVEQELVQTWSRHGKDLFHASAAWQVQRAQTSWQSLPTRHHLLVSSAQQTT
jgi:hypothetical protein